MGCVFMCLDGYLIMTVICTSEDGESVPTLQETELGPECLQKLMGFEALRLCH